MDTICCTPGELISLPEACPCCCQRLVFEFRYEHVGILRRSLLNMLVILSTTLSPPLLLWFVLNLKLNYLLGFKKYSSYQSKINVV